MSNLTQKGVKNPIKWDLTKIILKLISVIAIFFSLFHVYVNILGTVGGLTRNVVHLSSILVIIFLKSICSDKNRFKFIDILLLFGTLLSSWYLLTNIQEIMKVRAGSPNTIDIILGVFFIICLLVALQRTTGPALVLVILFFIIYMRFGTIFFGVLAHGGFSWERIIFRAYITNEGIWGTTITVSSTYIALFVIFASLLEKSGAGEYFIKLAMMISKGRRANSAWAAVISSCLMGTISGSSTANVLTTGVITIPLMKKIGFSPAEAGGIEAAASTGGMLMPPIMGAAAFLIPSFLDITYFEVIKAALIPALLYYFSILINIELISHKRKFTPFVVNVEKSDAKNLIKDGIVYFTPLFMLICLLISGRSPIYSAIWSMGTLIILVFFRERSIKKMKFIIDALEKAAYSMIQIAVVCGAAGLIVLSVVSTGIGSVLSYNLKLFTGGNIVMMLIVLAVISLILSMGMPATALYIVLVSTLAPALSALGIIPLAAHLFIFWFGAISGITPPLALASYAAVGISGANIWPLSFEAIRYGIVGYMAPFIFVFSPSILLLGNPHVFEIILRIVFSILGFFSLSIALQGWFKQMLPFYLRIAAMVTGILLLTPILLMNYIGLILLSLIIIIQLFFIKKREDVI